MKKTFMQLVYIYCFYLLTDTPGKFYNINDENKEFVGNL